MFCFPCGIIIVSFSKLISTGYCKRCLLLTFLLFLSVTWIRLQKLYPFLQKKKKLNEDLLRIKKIEKWKENTEEYWKI